MDIRQEVPIKSYSISAYICKIEAGTCKHLILRRKPGALGGTWQMVAGRIERGETGWEAALREIEEETGLKPDRFYSADTIEAFYDADQNCINLVPVFIAFIDSDQEVRLSHEHDTYQWIKTEEADAYLIFQQQREMLKTIEHSFVKSQPNPLLEIKSR